MIKPNQILAAFVLISGFTANAQPDLFSSAQWGLFNLGLGQRLELDHIMAYQLQGRKNEDIRLPAPLSLQKKILVAVLDTGVDHDHEDLKSVLHRNESECRALEKFRLCETEKSRSECEKIWLNLENPEVDQDKNGYPLDCSGWSTLGGVNAAGILGRPDFGDDQGHGTHVAGIIGAKSNNGIGVRGVSDNVEILPVQVLGNKPMEPIKPLSLNLSDLTNPDLLSPLESGRQSLTSNLGDLVARGVIYAIRSGAQVINFSLGWPQNADSEFLRSVIAEAQRRGIIIVAAAGNDSTRALLRPCAYPGVICVGAQNPDGSLAHFSNYGSGVEIAAPGSNILSTYPMSKRPVRFRSMNGYEYLNGTSQASPFVAGAVAEMRARGIPSNEVRARLILSSREQQAKLPLLMGAPQNLQPEIQVRSIVESKWILTGNLDLNAALAVSPQALILPATKEKTVVKWDGLSSQITFEFAFENTWQDLDFSKFHAEVTARLPTTKSIRPKVIETRWSSEQSPWVRGEKRVLQIIAEIQDNTPARTKISSDLEFDVKIDGQKQIIRLESEIVIPVQAELAPANWQKIPLVHLPPTRLSYLPVDEKLDGKSDTDYFAVSTENQTNRYYLMKFMADSRQYLIQPNSIKIKFGENIEKVREQYLIRIDRNFDGLSDYVLGLYKDLSEEGKPSPAHFRFMNSNFVQQDEFILDGMIAQTPTRVFWHKTGSLLMPAWVGPGLDTNKQVSLRDQWENPDQIEAKKIRFYYVDQNKKLKSIEKHNNYQIVDILQPTTKQIKLGKIPVLLAQNRGTKAKSSYLYRFATAEVSNGQIENFESLDFELDQRSYRNLLDTRVDQVSSLDLRNTPGQDQTSGTFWFGEGPQRSQRISLLKKDKNGFHFYDQILPAVRGRIDASLWVRAAYAGTNEIGAFVLTNSELQYHDLKTSEVVAKSFERYTFYSDLLFSNLHFPTQVLDTQSQKLRPALFTTQSSGLSRGVRIVVPIRDEQGHLVEIQTPARLRLESERGCRPLETPVELENGGLALDYYCGNMMMRVPIEM